MLVVPAERLLAHVVEPFLHYVAFVTFTAAKIPIGSDEVTRTRAATFVLIHLFEHAAGLFDDNSWSHLSFCSVKRAARFEVFLCLDLQIRLLGLLLLLSGPCRPRHATLVWHPAAARPNPDDVRHIELIRYNGSGKPLADEVRLRLEVFRRKWKIRQLEH